MIVAHRSKQPYSPTHIVVCDHCRARHKHPATASVRDAVYYAELAGWQAARRPHLCPLCRERQ